MSISSDSPIPAESFDVVIIGAGFSGLGMLQRTREAGLSARLYEAGDDVGGTWFWNRYPGACCDAESSVYSFSFSRELLEEWEWHSRYPWQPEVLAYLNHVADRFELRRDIQFETRVTGAIVDEESGRWVIETDRAESVAASFLITAVGCLSASQMPDIPGIDGFQGESFHTAHWPREQVDFSGKRVGVIGTGSSGIQVIPEVAKEAEQLIVFQRTPNFAIPSHNRPLEPSEIEELKANGIKIREDAKQTPAGTTFAPLEELAIEVEPAEREQHYRSNWENGGLAFVYGSFQDLLVDPVANETAAEFVRAQIREIVEDPETAEMLTPRDHPIGTKRPALDAGYYATFNRPNVHLIDIRQQPIEQITATGIRTDTEEVDLDAIVFATGFDAMTGALSRIDIRTSGGRRLSEKWAGGPQTYLGLTAAGFPNLFMITAPGSPSVLTNMPVSIEQHVNWIGDCLEYMREHDVQRIEADDDAEEQWTKHVDDIASQTLMPQANSWYMGANTPGKPRRFMPYAGGVGEYRRVCTEVAEDGYRGFEMAAAAGSQKPDPVGFAD